MPKLNKTEQAIMKHLETHDHYTTELMFKREANAVRSLTRKGFVTRYWYEFLNCKPTKVYVCPFMPDTIVSCELKGF
jgi:hypothetical protein